MGYCLAYTEDVPEGQTTALEKNRSLSGGFFYCFPS